MNTTLHLFRHDVRRLRWWLVAWAGFLVGTHGWWYLTAWSEPKTSSSHWLPNFLDADVFAFWANHGFIATLVALLLLPHGADGVRLFWRTRPITGRDVVQAKFLFAGLLLVAVPVLVESSFWLAWWPWVKLTEFWPDMLLERTAWVALFVLVVGLAGREGKRYLFCALGLLLVCGGWLQVTEQVRMRELAAAGGDPWPLMQSPHLLGQLVEFWTKNAATPVHMTAAIAALPVGVLAVAGWLVVACHYLWPGWRAVRLALESTVLVAVAALFGLNEFGLLGNRHWEKFQQQAADHRIALARAVEGVQVRLKEARLVPDREVLGRERRSDDNKRAAVFTWETSGQPSGTVLLTGTMVASSDGHSGSIFSYAENAMSVGTMPEYVGKQLPAAMPELSGYALRTNPELARVWTELHADWAEKFSREPQAAKAKVLLATLTPTTLAVLPVRQAACLTLDRTRISLTGGQDPRLRLEVPSKLVDRYLWDHSLVTEGPNLFVLRNPKTREAFILDRFLTERTYGGATAPGSSRSLDIIRTDCQLTKVVERHGLTAAWLADAELLCVRMKLVGHTHRKVELENFRLEPAKE